MSLLAILFSSLYSLLSFFIGLGKATLLHKAAHYVIVQYTR